MMSLYLFHNFLKMFLSPNVIMSKFSNTGFKKTKRHKYKKQKRRRTRRHYLRGG
jgi:hypothetical protein